jgi:hypothetical protein
VPAVRAGSAGRDAAGVSIDGFEVDSAKINWFGTCAACSQAQG